MINQFFDRVVCLTTSRWDRAVREFDKYDIKVERFNSVKHDNPMTSFNMSQRKLMKDLWESGCHSALVLEDDVVFQNMKDLPAVLDDLERWVWDICYFGGNYQPHWNVTPPIKVSKNLRRIYNAWTTHSIAYQRDAIEHIHRAYKADAPYDAWLDEYVLGELYTVATVPLLAVQEKGYSDLWKHDVDYTDTWQKSLDFIK